MSISKGKKPDEDILVKKEAYYIKLRERNIEYKVKK